MLLFYIRHGDPTYNPDSLTALGMRQAEALGKRLALYGVDRVYASTSQRAISTARPLCEMIKKEMTLLDFCNEKYAARDFNTTDSAGRTWFAFMNPELAEILVSDEVRALDKRWYEHPQLRKYNFGEGVRRVDLETDKLLSELGYEHDRAKNMYRAVRPSEERLALFAHAGFGMAFLSSVLDIPYPQFSKHFDLCHSGMTVIEFENTGEWVIPRILTLSSDSHIYREGLPTCYNNRIRF